MLVCLLARMFIMWLIFVNMEINCNRLNKGLFRSVWQNSTVHSNQNVIFSLALRFSTCEWKLKIKAIAMNVLVIYMYNEPLCTLCALHIILFCVLICVCLVHFSYFQRNTKGSRSRLYIQIFSSHQNVDWELANIEAITEC